MQAIRSAREAVECYNLEVWNGGDYELAVELLADSVIRHQVGSRSVLTRDEMVDHIRAARAAYRSIEIRLSVVLPGADGQHVTVVYDCDATDHEGRFARFASIEIFRVVGGRIAEQYFTEPLSGAWK